MNVPPVWCNHAPPYCPTMGECQMRRRTDEPTACLPPHDGGPALRPHGTPGWWQVWSGGICVALLRPEDADVIRRETIEECATWLEDSEDLDVIAGRLRGRRSTSVPPTGSK